VNGQSAALVNGQLLKSTLNSPLEQASELVPTIHWPEIHLHSKIDLQGKIHGCLFFWKKIPTFVQ